MNKENPFNSPAPPQEETPKQEAEAVEQSEQREALPNSDERPAEVQKGERDEHADERGLIADATRLIEDYKIYTEPMRAEGKHPDKDFSSQREAKLLLIEGLAHHLAKRLKVGDGIDVVSVAALSAKTGVDFSGVVTKVYRGPVREQESGGVLPQLGVEGTWKTARGNISGRVVSGRPGGPYIIQTPKGKIQVDKLD